MNLLSTEKYVLRLLMIGILLLFNGCGDSSSSSYDSNEDGSTAQPQQRVVIQGAVYDAAVPFADVTFMLYPNTVLGSVTADAEGRWQYEVLRSKLSEGQFLLLSAINPVNGLEIRSSVKIEEILEREDLFVSAQTTISHFSEAALSLMLGEGRVDEFYYEKFMKKLAIEHGIPQKTGVPEIDSLAAIVQKHFDDENGSYGAMIVDTYIELIKILNGEQERLPVDDVGGVLITLPKHLNQYVDVIMESDEEVNIQVDSDKAIVQIPPGMIQMDINISVIVRYGDKEKRTTLFVPGRGKISSDYVFTIPDDDEYGFLHTNVFVNGVWYTVVPYAPMEVEFSTLDVQRIKGTVMGKPFDISIPDSLQGAYTVLRIFRGKDRLGSFDEAVVQSKIIKLDSMITQVEAFSIENTDDFRPPVPMNFNMSTPSAVAVF